MNAAAVYAWISSDDGTALGAARQVEDCRALAASLGWTVAEGYSEGPGSFGFEAGHLGSRHLEVVPRKRRARSSC